MHVIDYNINYMIDYLSGIKQLLEVLQGSNDALAFLLSLTANACLHVLLVPLIDRRFTTGQEPLSKNDEGAIILDQEPHNPETGDIHIDKWQPA